MPKPPARDDKYDDEQKTMKNTLSKRLKELRKGKGLSYEKLREELQENYHIEISKQALTNYEVEDPYNSKYEAGFGMNITYLWAIAKYYDVSTDYLLGLTDCKSPDIDVQGIHDVTGLSQTVVEKIEGWKSDSSHAGFIEILNDILSDDDFDRILNEIDIFYNLYRLKDFVFENLTSAYTNQIAEAILKGNNSKGESSLISLRTGFDKDIFLSKAQNAFTYMLGKIAYYKFEKGAPDNAEY